jgi:hypothetical protein
VPVLVEELWGWEVIMGRGRIAPWAIQVALTDVPMKRDEVLKGMVPR